VKELRQANHPTVPIGATAGGGAGGGSSTLPPSGAALWQVGGSGELQVLSKAAIQTKGNNWRIRIRDDMPGTTGGLPSLGIGPDPKDTLKTLFTMDLPDNLGNYDYDFLETYAPDYFQVSLHATSNLIKFAEFFNLPSQGSPDNNVLAPPGGNPGAQDVWDGSLWAGLSDSGFPCWGGYVPVPTSGGSGSSGPLTTTGVASNAVENDEVFTDDGFLSSIMFVSVGQFTSVIAAHGRIMDADIALEFTRFARHNVLVQASAAMTAQANQLTNVVLTLLG